MCFYDANEMACRCWKWGHFRQHCSKEYRTGETCGIKLVMNRYSLPEKCKICTKIDTKERCIRKEEDKIRRWRKESNRNASIQKAQDDIYKLESDIERLKYDRDMKNSQSASEDRHLEIDGRMDLISCFMLSLVAIFCFFVVFR
jgi:hypothetical protein